LFPTEPVPALNPGVDTFVHELPAEVLTTELNTAQVPPTSIFKYLTPNPPKFTIKFQVKDYIILKKTRL
jgi:hypothetical protein